MIYSISVKNLGTIEYVLRSSTVKLYNLGYIMGGGGGGGGEVFGRIFLKLP